MPERYFGVTEYSKPSENHYNVCQIASAVLHFSEDGMNLTEPMSKRVSKNGKYLLKHRKTKPKSTSEPPIDLKRDA